MKAVKQLLKIALVLILFVSCGEDKEYIIDGVVYGGVNFEGQQVKLAPMVGATYENTDSTIIHNGKFRFEGVVETDELCVIHVPPMLRVFLVREPILIKEPGHIRVILGEKNIVKGTALNDSLQAWNDYKSKIDSTLKVIHQQMKHVDAAGQLEYLDKADKLRLQLDAHIREVSLRNNNMFGDYIDKFAK